MRLPVPLSGPDWELQIEGVWLARAAAQQQQTGRRKRGSGKKVLGLR
jgi:hypothetical protein